MRIIIKIFEVGEGWKWWDEAELIEETDDAFKARYKAPFFNFKVSSWFEKPSIGGKFDYQKIVQVEE
jgi:hypothetical protein